MLIREETVEEWAEWLAWRLTKLLVDEAPDPWAIQEPEWWDRDNPPPDPRQTILDKAAGRGNMVV